MLLLIILCNIQLYIMGKYIDEITTDFPDDTNFQPEDVNNNYNTILQQSN